MDILKHKKLKKKLEESAYSEKFQSIRIALDIFSYMGHLACIFSSYFFISSLIMETEPEAIPLVVGIVSVIILMVVEYLKRVVIYRWSEDFVNPEKRKSSWPLLIATLIMQIISFYFTLNGTEKFSNREFQTTKQIESQTKMIQDSIYKVHSPRIIQLQNRLKVVDSLKTQIEIKSTDLAISENGKRSSIKSVSNLSSRFQDQIKDINNEISKEKELSKKEISDLVTELQNQKGKDIKRSSNNMISFIIMLIVTEFIILFGIWYHSYYEYTSINDGEELINSNESLRNFILWDETLEVMFGTGPKPLSINSQAPTPKDLLELCRASGIMVSEQDLRDKFYRILTAIGILETRGSRRYVKQNLKIAKTLLKKQFKQ